MTIAAAATGAAFGFIYIRDEYPLAVERTNRALRQARERGLLGANILGTELSYDMAVVRGAGAYVCGEETGLLSSIQDDRGMPRIKPPFPANAGVFGLPTNVNNVETYACAPLAFRNGVEWYKSVGTERSPGTKMFSITGDVERTGALEVPFGTPVRRLVMDACGGIRNGRELKIIQTGGPLAGFLPARTIDTPLDVDPFRELKVLMGGGGIVIGDDTTCPVDLTQYFEWFAEDESCGRCTTCLRGTQRYVEILRRIQQGDGRMSDIPLLELLTQTLAWSNCFHGQGAPAAVVSLLMYFREELVEHIQEKRCRAGVCRVPGADPLRGRSGPRGRCCGRCGDLPDRRHPPGARRQLLHRPGTLHPVRCLPGNPAGGDPRARAYALGRHGRALTFASGASRWVIPAM
jgi:NADH:ubiquinone oxidoreductase subunit F (NADH-binding)